MSRLGGGRPAPPTWLLVTAALVVAAVAVAAGHPGSRPVAGRTGGPAATPTESARAGAAVSAVPQQRAVTRNSFGEPAVRIPAAGGGYLLSAEPVRSPSSARWTLTD
ncbi:MAG TPA: hypothetical protein VMB79_03130 [Jatrophihabitans sp.]|nr:hypothetical protein [Jatrophihabitans sp.]